ncbi:MAG: hypothetical protein QXK12_00845 [Candidatus Nezhaarchaeales archaeon]
MTGERVTRPLQAGLKLRVDFGVPREIVVPEELLAMLTEETRKIVMDEAVNDNQRFKALVEELHWGKYISIEKLSKRLSVPLTTLWKWMRHKMNVKVRDNVTALQLANTKYAKRDFDGDDAEKLRLWYFAHTDGSVIQNGQQVQVILGTPDPYLALLFKEVFGKYGYVGVTPYRDSKGYHAWMLWSYLPLRSYWWLLERRTPTLIDSDVKLYNALSITIDAEGSVCARSREGRTTEFKVVLYNEKVYVVKPLYEALKQYGYRVKLNVTAKGTTTNYGRTSNDCYHISIRAKAHVKRLLSNVELTLPHKRLKALLIKRVLKETSEPVYWSTIEPFYSEVEAVHEELLMESKRVLKSLHETWQALTKEGRDRLRAKAWGELQALKEKYDGRFKELERRIEAYFRAQRPLP